MANIKRRRVKDYPYKGSFFRKTEPDYSLPLDERDLEDELVFETECDIQEVSKAANPVLIATFSIFMPWKAEEDIPINRGMRFEGKMGNNIDVCGMVTNVVLSQLDGLVAYVKDYDSED